MSQRKLLLADDSITIQKVVNLTFADEGIEVITVGDGDSAMLKITEESPDLVLADVNMPGLNGYQVCEQIRQSGARPETPVILLVGSFEPFDRAEAERVGANDFLTKPFQSIRQLVNKVTELLAASNSGDGNAIQAEASTDFENAETVSSFDVSHANELPESSVAASAHSFGGFGDGAVDDELIQTSNASGFALDEAAKFESRTISEPEDAAQTQPLSAADLERFSIGGANPESTNDRLEEVDASDSSPDEIEEELSTAQAASENEAEEISSQTSAQSDGVSASSADDDDLLELSFDDEEDWDDEEDEIEESTAPVEASSDESAAQSQSEQQSLAPISISATESGDYAESATVSTEVDAFSAAPDFAAAHTETTEPEMSDSETSNSETMVEPEQNPISTEANAFPAQLSPEMIDAIAQRVVEKLSDRAVKDVAWEVVPQMADLIIKKMAEEKLKQ